MSRRATSLLFSAALLLPAAIPAAERALAFPMGASGRDAILVRSGDGSGFTLFAPRKEGGFELRSYSGEGPDVEQVILTDANGDGANDLVSVRRDGTTSKWYATRDGDFTPEEIAPAPGHGAHGGHSAAGIDPAHAAHMAEQAARDLSDWIETGASTRADASLRIGDAGVASVDPDGRTLRLRRNDGGVTTLPADLLPPAFRARTLAAGHFGDRGELLAALVDGGKRPRLVLLDPAPLAMRDAGEIARESYRVREAVPALTTFMVTVGSGGFNFAPQGVNIQPGDTVQWNWAGIGHTVTSGPGCTVDGQFCSPSNTNCSTAATSSTGATYSHAFPVSGVFPYFCRPHCIAGMVGSVTVAAAAAPGAVPDGDTVPGIPIKLGKGGAGTINVTWTASCSGGANNYALYEGTIPILGAYTHASLNCNLGNVTTASFAPGAGNTYYLVVPQTASAEGAYGSDRIGGAAHAIPAAGTPCHPQSVAPCP